jgi:hypothetical protein
VKNTLKSKAKFSNLVFVKPFRTNTSLVDRTRITQGKLRIVYHTNQRPFQEWMPEVGTHCVIGSYVQFTRARIVGILYKLLEN